MRKCTNRKLGWECAGWTGSLSNLVGVSQPVFDNAHVEESKLMQHGECQHE